MLKLLFTILLIPAAAWTRPRLVEPLPCPAAADWTDDTLALPEGCPAPRTGRLYTMEAHAAVAAELAQLDTLLDERDRQLATARQERDAAQRQAADELREAATRVDALNAQVEQLADPPRRSAWLLLGELLGAGAIIVSDQAGLDGLPSAGIGLGVLGGAGLLAAWLDDR